jgi:cell division septation protein DedD
MANKDFREIQVSSSLLVIIFLGVLALGVFIFLLGVSVGKKQAAVAAPTQIVTQQIPEEVNPPAVKPTAPETASNDAGPAASRETAKPQSKETTASQAPASKTPTTAKKTTAAGAPAASGLYYVQVAAFSERASAQALADKYKSQGYTAIVTSRVTSTKTWYRVRLGGYGTRDQAADLLAKLNAAAGKKTDFQIVHD